jgi:hypothetical protein
MIAFPCPSCGKELRVKDEFGGRTGRCPHCKKPAPVPLAAAARAAGAAGEGPGPAAPAAAAPEPEAETYSSDGPSGVNPPAAAPAPELTDFLGPPQGPGELGRLGHYRVLKVLGAGGMGVVFHAEDILLHRPVALKAMLPVLAASPTNRERFTREARAAAAVEHDHVVAIHQISEDRGVPFLVMPLLRGEPLDARLAREKKLPPREVLRVGREAAEGLSAAHARGLVHRDVKPGNIWLEEGTGRVKILDFGLARAGSGEVQLTQQGAFLGTPAYSAPEQAGGQPVDARSDLFSLGCVLYRAATGKLPFQGTDTISTLLAVATVDPPPPLRLDPGLPPRLSDLIMRLLAKKPEDRPPSARAVADALAEVERAPAAAPRAPAPARTAAGRTGSRVQVVRLGPADAQTVPTSRERRPPRRPAGRRPKPPVWPWVVGGAVAAGAAAAVLVAVLVIATRKREAPVAAGEPPEPAGRLLPPREPAPGPGAGPPAPPLAPGPVPAVPVPVPAPGRPPPVAPADAGAPLLEPAHVADAPAGNSKLVFSPTGRHFACGSGNVVQIHDAATGKVLHTLAGGGDALTFSPDGARLAGLARLRVVVWDVATGRELAAHRLPVGNTAAGLWFQPDGQLRCAAFGHTPPGVIKILDGLTLAEQGARLTGHTAVGRSFLVSADGRRAVSTALDQTTRVWDLVARREVAQLQGPGKPLRSLALAPDGRRVVATYHEPDVRVFDADTGREVRRFTPPTLGETGAVAFAPGGKVVCGAGFDGVTRLLDDEWGRVLLRLKGGNLSTSVAASRDGQAVAAADLAGKVYVFRPGEAPRPARGPRRPEGAP